jgi:glycosyltransferase involved in cell wall biosynthesis
MPSYNSSKFISETIQSVQAQTFSDWELIIVDDCSEDQSYEIIESYTKEDDRVKSFRFQQRSGPATTRNKSIEEAKGRYIAFLDSDDLWLPDKLEEQINFMKSMKSVFSFTAYEKIDEQGIRIGNAFEIPPTLNYQQLLTGCVIGCLTAMYDQEFLGKLYMPSILKGQDYAMWLKILKKTKVAHGLNEVLAQYRIRPDSISRNKYIKLKYIWKMYREIEELSFLKSLYCITCHAYGGYKRSKA